MESLGRGRERVSRTRIQSVVLAFHDGKHLSERHRVMRRGGICLEDAKAKKRELTEPGETRARSGKEDREKRTHSSNRR
jgi:hypothetical protein